MTKLQEIFWYLVVLLTFSLLVRLNAPRKDKNHKIVGKYKSHKQSPLVAKRI